MRPTATVLVLLAAACASAPAPRPPEHRVVATFSIIGCDPETGDLGVAVQSKFFGVGSVVPWAKAGVGAVATQAFANTTYGPRALGLLAEGRSPKEALAVLTAADEGRDRRQVGIVDAKGEAASFTGAKAMAWAGHRTGKNYACQGNILAGEEVIAAMANAFEATPGPLPERLVAALAAGQAAGGDKRGMQSAALLVVREGGGYGGFNDRFVDLRVEDHERPIEELARLLALHREFYGTVPAPKEMAGFAPEPAPAAPGTLATPRAAFETLAAAAGAGDAKALYALYSAAWRQAHPYEEFEKEIRDNAEGIRTFFEAARYEGTRIEGEKASVAVAGTGSGRPVVFRYVREEGEWRLAE